MCGQCASIAVLDLAVDHGKTDRAADATIEFVTAFCRVVQDAESRGWCFGAAERRWEGKRSMSGRAHPENGITREEKEAQRYSGDSRGERHRMYAD